MPGSSANWVEVQDDLETGLVAGRSYRLDVHKPSPVAVSETDMAFDQGEQCVVTPPAHAAARVKPGAALADDDRPGLDRSTVEHLHAQPLAGAIAPVAGAARRPWSWTPLKPPW